MKKPKEYKACKSDHKASNDLKAKLGSLQDDEACKVASNFGRSSTVPIFRNPGPKNNCCPYE